ncbi:MULTISPECIES: hypothetical protein [unclassified Imperialibacter]|nr:MULTISPECIES: hypothetical protein [unclassified Imperialibacter]
MSFWISFPFWMMLLLLALNGFLVSSFSASIKDDETNNPPGH